MKRYVLKKVKEKRIFKKTCKKSKNILLYS